MPLVHNAFVFLTPYQPAMTPPILTAKMKSLCLGASSLLLAVNEVDFCRTTDDKSIGLRTVMLLGVSSN